MERAMDKDREADASELATYFAKFSAALSRLEGEMARWKAYEDDYVALKSTLLDLPNETSHAVMVPIGSMAFMPGKLIHTNEVMVMLGDNWFVDRSAAQAAEMVDRRMEFVQENITKLQEQEDQIRAKSGMAPGLLGGQEYNEEGLPIVEITEPYYSDDELYPDTPATTTPAIPKTPVVPVTLASATKSSLKQQQVNKETKPVQSTPAPGLLPFSQKSPQEQAEDRAILDRIAEMEREDEERERRREAGEIVTSDEDSDDNDDDNDGFIRYPEDEEDNSEDDFRPKALDSDEEYEEEVWEHSADEEDEDEDEDQTHASSSSSSKGRKSVRFADQVAKSMKPKSAKAHTVAPALQPTPAIATLTTPTAIPAIKPKSPSDLISQMKARKQQQQQQAAHLSSSSSGADQIVTMENLESAIASMSGTAEPPATLLKSALKPTLNKTSLPKQPVQESVVTETLVKPSSLQVDPEAAVATATPQKKLSKFAMDRAAAAAAAAGSASPSTLAGATPAQTVSDAAKPAVGRVSERVIEHEVIAPSPPKKLSKFARDRAATAEATESASLSTLSGVKPAQTLSSMVKPPVGGVSERIIEHETIAPSPQKKLSKFAKDRAAAVEATGSASSSTLAGVPSAQMVSDAVKPAVGGVSERVIEHEVITSTPQKKLSKFARDRAAAAETTGSASPSPVAGVAPAQTRPDVVKPAVGGVFERAYVRGAIASKPSTLSSNNRTTTAAGVYEVVERGVAPLVVEEKSAATPTTSSIVGMKDVVENPFRKPAAASKEKEEDKEKEEEQLPTSAGRRKKPSLFRQHQQQLSQSHLEPEPALPGSSFRGEEDDDDDRTVPARRAIPQVVSSRSISASRGSVVERSSKSAPASVQEKPTIRSKLATVGGGSEGPSGMRKLPIVSSSKLKDTALMKGVVVEREEIEPVDEDELEDDMLMRQVVSEYQERRQAMIAKHGAFNREDIERMWEQQVVIPPEMIVSDELEKIMADQVPDQDQDHDHDEDDSEDEHEEDGEDDQDAVLNEKLAAAAAAAALDDRNQPPKKLSLFRASRLSGTLAKR
ncbi:uri1, prefoldin-like chaperone [Dissophora globulifera]|uniref:Uri1, prefoldin-like chaperone n=1 Tax=Dissophora globulifera TaxID=979702 RepID=A0A9P6RGT6_9FUNG|nr:uri1, prefoldin-like chaperone [Dissophora globulifera]